MLRVRRVLMVWAWIVAASSAGARACDYSPDMPERVFSLRDRSFTMERMTELAREWEQYVGRHPKSALAYVYWARARTYSRTGSSDDIKLLEKAFAIDPNCPEVLSMLANYQFGVSLAGGKPGMEVVKRNSRRAIELRPDWYEPHVNLLMHDLIFGDEAGMREQLRAMLSKGAFPAVLMDYAYNMLATTEPDAILFTNGDNDTYPVLALQLVHGVRQDVLVVNIASLNSRLYAERMLAVKAPILTADWIATQRRGPEPNAFVVVTELLNEVAAKVASGSWTKPVYCAVTIPLHSLPKKLTQRMVQEGLLYRVRRTPPPAPLDGPRPHDVVRTDSLLSHVYRLESTLDFGHDWLRSGVTSIVLNYAGAFIRAGSHYADSGDAEAAARMMRGAVRILDFQAALRPSEKPEQLLQVLEAWKKADPRNPEIDAWLRKAKR